MFHGRRKLFYEIAGPLIQTLHNANCAEKHDLVSLADIDPYHGERHFAKPKTRARPTRKGKGKTT